MLESSPIPHTARSEREKPQANSIDQTQRLKPQQVQRNSKLEEAVGHIHTGARGSRHDLVFEAEIAQ